MLKNQYLKTEELIARRRFALLLLATVLVLILPAFAGNGTFFGVTFMATISFLFIQSLLAANIRKPKNNWRYYIVLVMITLAVLEPLGIRNLFIDLLKAASFITFFVFIIIHLVRFINTTPRVDQNVLMASMNIYLLGGIIGAFLAFAFFRIYPDAYNLPEHITHPNIVTFLYYSFITMSTVGYGDITPAIPETQTLAYLLSVTGQLYVAIILAFLVGKMLLAAGNKSTDS